MRHPSIIGLYAWGMQKGTIPQIGMVIEFAGGGDLEGLYREKHGKEYSFKLGVKIALDVARGLEYMHTMPTAVVHRDIKSAK